MRSRRISASSARRTSSILALPEMARGDGWTFFLLFFEVFEAEVRGLRAGGFSRALPVPVLAAGLFGRGVRATAGSGAGSVKLSIPSASSASKTAVLSLSRFDSSI